MAKKWHKQVLKMKKDHGWRTRRGYRIFVADRGAFRFHFPETWLIRPAEDCIRFHDAEPPDDNFTLGVSYVRLPPIDWSGLPVCDLVQEIGKEDEREVIQIGEIAEPDLPQVEAAWQELTHIDPLAKRPAFGRYGLARAANIQVLLTLDYWPEDAETVRTAWDEILRTLELGRYIEDPTVGDRLH